MEFFGVNVRCVGNEPCFTLTTRYYIAMIGQFSGPHSTVQLSLFQNVL